MHVAEGLFVLIGKSR